MNWYKLCIGPHVALKTGTPHTLKPWLAEEEEEEEEEWLGERVVWRKESN